MTGTMKTITPTLRGVLAACVITFATLPVGAQDYAPVVIVNDEIITGYDIAQRQLLLTAASGGEPISRDQVIDLLIDDLLRLQAARKAGVTPNKEQIDAGFNELSSAQGRDPQAMRNYFRSQGISDRALDKQIAAEVAWRNLIPRTFMPRIRITDSEVDEAMGSSAAAITENQYLLSEIRLPIDARGEAAAIAEANAILAQLSQGSSFGEIARSRSQGSTAAAGGDIGWVNESSLSNKTREMVAPLGKDRVTRPYVVGNEVILTGVRNIRGPQDNNPARYRLSQLVVGVAPDAAPSIASLALQRAQATRAQITDCASVEALKAGYLPISGDIGELAPNQMPIPVRNAVINLPKGGITEPVRSNDGFHIIVVCDKIENAAAASATSPDEDQMRRRLTAAKLSRFSSSLMRKLRREAVIERR